MKKTILLLMLLLLIGCKSKTAIVAPVTITYTKIPLTEVDASQKKKAYDLGKRVLMICNTSKFIPFKESEATASVIKNTTLEKHSEICLKFRARYGNFKDMKLIETYKNNTDNEILFRYKALYERSHISKELRITLNQENKVSSIKTMNWADSFQHK